MYAIKIYNFPYSDFNVVVGLHGLDDGSTSEEIPVVEVIVHENYNEGGSGGPDNDIMLLRLERDVPYADFVAPVCLPRMLYQVPDDTPCYTTGWGALSCKFLLVSVLCDGPNLMAFTRAHP